MSIEKLTEKILSEAQEYADSAVAEAEIEGKELTSKAKEKANKILSDVQDKINIETKKVFNRRNSLARLETRKMILQAKQDAVNECFDKAIDELRNMDEGAYISFLADTLNTIGVDGGEVVFNKKDAESIGERIITRANESGKEFRMSEERIDARGGFKVVSGKVEISATLESMVENIREEITTDVANALFN